MKQAADAKLILLSGKHIEHYLDKVQQATGGKGESLSVGDALPNLKMKTDPDKPAEKADADANGMIDDPHWWNSVPKMGRYQALGWWRNYREADRLAVDHALQAMELKDLEDRQISALSGGQQQRAFLARALAHFKPTFFQELFMNMVWLVEPFRHEFMQRALFGCALIGFTNGALSSFIVIRRLALMADAMAHSLLPGAPSPCYFYSCACNLASA